MMVTMLKQLLTSKKAWAALTGIFVTVVAPKLRLSPDQAMTIAGLCGAYVAGQGLADLGKNAK